MSMGWRQKLKNNRREMRADIEREDKKVNLREVRNYILTKYYYKLNPTAAKWRDFRLQKPRQVDVQVYGSPIPLVWGTFRVPCDVIWSTPITPVSPATVEEESNSPFQENYSASFAVRVAGNEQSHVLKIWANKVLIYDRFETNTNEYASHPNFYNHVSFYTGSETQTASPIIEDIEGAGAGAAYRGISYIVFKDLPLQRFGNELPEIEVEVSSSVSEVYNTHDVASFAVPTDPANYLISRATGALYHMDNTTGILSVVRRRGAILGQEINVGAALATIDAGASLVGVLTNDEGAGGFLEPLYFLCDSTAGAAFVLRYDGAFTSNFSASLSGVSHNTCFVHKDRLYTADQSSGEIRCYDKVTLALLWRRATAHAGHTPGNFTYDNSGKLWLVWYDGGAATTTYLSRISPGGNIFHYTLSSGAAASRGIMYDTSADTLLCGGGAGGFLVKIPLPVSTATRFASKTASNCGPLFTSQYRFSKSSYWCNGTSILRIRTTTVVTKETIALSNFADTGTGTEHYGYGQLERSFWICRNASPGLSKLPLNRFSRGTLQLSDLVQDLCARAGLATTDIDVTALSPTVKGFALTERTTAQEPLDFLLTAYSAAVREHFESGYTEIQLEFIHRSTQASVVTIPEEDLGIGDGAPEEEILQEEWTSEEELPRRVNVRYADPRRDYDTHSQKDEIDANVTTATREFTLDFPGLVLTDDQGKQLAEIVLASSWIEGAIKRFTLPLKYLYLEPEDIVTVTFTSVSHVVRLETVELGANYILECTGVVCSVAGYSSTATGEAAPETGHKVNVPTQALMVLVDCPCVRDQDGLAEDAGFYAFGGTQQADTEFPGYRLLRSKDGASWASLVTSGAVATIAVTTSALPDGPTTSFDTASLVDIRLLSGTFTTHTEAELYLGRLTNLCAIGTEEGGWELIQFSSFNDNGDGTGQLDQMLRGRFGTEHKTAAHGIGEYVVLFDFNTPATHRIVLPLSDRNLASLYKCVPMGAPPSNAGQREFTNTALGLTPWTPVAISGSLSGGDWTILWTRRTRIGFDLMDYADEALNEEAEEYEIDLRDSPSGAVYRTITVLEVETSGITITAVAATQKFTRASGSWITDGFVVGQRIESAGWADSECNGRFTISALTAADMTVTNGIENLIDSVGVGPETITAVTQGYLYTAAQQAVDGGSKSTFYATFYQISQRLRDNDGVGRGIGVQELIS